MTVCAQGLTEGGIYELVAVVDADEACVIDRVVEGAEPNPGC